MALLRRIARTPRAAGVALLCMVILGVASCMLDKLATGEKPYAFSHRVHVVDQKLACEDCHFTWDSKDDPGMPKAAQCALCHSELDSKKPAERRVASLYDNKKYKKTYSAALGDEIVFSHQKHATRGDECGTCHANLERNGQPRAPAAFGMDTCTQCHEQRQAKSDCAQCHKEIRAELPPPNHGDHWTRTHGRVVRACTGQTSDRCELCHKESSCETCHMAVTPENHTNYFRRRGHGIVASMDRQTCSACHKPDSCERCHSETRPMDHVGGWGAPNDRHCIVCHDPLRGQTCYVCHKDTPSHTLATPLPPDHNLAMNCRMCHGNGQPLPHVDNGQQCTLCHR